MDIGDLVFSWRALATVGITTVLTQLAKLAIDYDMGGADGRQVKATVRCGADLRKQHLAFNEILLPMIPLLIGMLLSTLVSPLRPEILEHDAYWQGSLWGAARIARFAAWGAVIGVFSGFVYSRLHGAMRVLRWDSRAG